MRGLLHAALICVVLCGATAVAQGATPPSRRYALSAPDAALTVEAAAIDRNRALAEDIGKPKSARLRYALRRAIQNVSVSDGRASAGEWRDLPGGMMLWRLPVHVDGALSLDVGFKKFFLPPGAQLYISNSGHQRGPYTDADNPRSGIFWTPILYGDHALIEVLLPQNMRPYLRLQLTALHAGYRDIFAPVSRAKSFFDPTAGSGACNVDTICSQGNPWRSEINAEAVLASDGEFCSGQLLNDTRADHAPLMSTANHCMSTQADADSLIVYWKYESPTCRVVGSAANAAPVPTNAAIAQVGGATLLATYQAADFTLMRLNQAPPVAANAYWNGWDRSDTAFNGGAVMHHALSDAKRISLAAGSVTIDDTDYGQQDVPGLHHWRVDHYSAGTTEAGSSGSGLIDANHHLRGVLSGGSADCSEPDGDDFYGRLSTAWNGGGAPENRLRDWLDPLGTQPQAIAGSGGCAIPQVTLGSSENPARAGDPVQLVAGASGGVPPYSFQFDVDGDGVADSVASKSASVTTVYPGTYSGNVGVEVTDAAGCTGSASRALVVDAQNVQFTGNGTTIPDSLLCGSATGGLQPGMRLRIPVLLHNNGLASTSHAYAVFAQNIDDPAHAAMTIETPLIALPTLTPGASTWVYVDYAISPDAACGSPVAIDYIGTVDDNGFGGERATVTAHTLAGSTECHAQTMCPARVVPVTPHAGNYFDPKRGGNGMTVVLTPVADSDPIFFGAWFTGDAQRRPSWFVVNAALHGKQVNTALYQTHQDVPGQYPVPVSSVGTAQVSLVSTDKFVYTWSRDGKSGGAVYVPVVADPARSVRSWYNPTQSGWGSFDELYPAYGSGGLPFAFNLTYIYDAAGNPRWTTGSDSSYRDGDSLQELVVRPTCPGCVWLDYLIGTQTAGTLRYNFTGSSERVTTDIAFPSDYAGSWIRDDFGIVPLVP
ncbi:MAG: PKD domain-containing protein [Rudaea sp.]